MFVYMPNGQKGTKKGTTGMASSFAGRRQFDQSWAGQFLSDKPSQSSSPFPQTEQTDAI